MSKTITINDRDLKVLRRCADDLESQVYRTPPNNDALRAKREQLIGDHADILGILGSAATADYLPQRCCVCSAVIPVGLGWQHGLIANGAALTLVSCNTEVCKERVERVKRPEQAMTERPSIDSAALSKAAAELAYEVAPGGDLVPAGTWGNARVAPNGLFVAAPDYAVGDAVEVKWEGGWIGQARVAAVGCSTDRDRRVTPLFTVRMDASGARIMASAEMLRRPLALDYAVWDRVDFRQHESLPWESDGTIVRVDAGHIHVRSRDGQFTTMLDRSGRIECWIRRPVLGLAPGDIRRPALEPRLAPGDQVEVQLCEGAEWRPARIMAVEYDGRCRFTVQLENGSECYLSPQWIRRPLNDYTYAAGVHEEHVEATSPLDAQVLARRLPIDKLRESIHAPPAAAPALYDGLTAEQCLERLRARGMAADGLLDPGAIPGWPPGRTVEQEFADGRLALTTSQLAAARELWSAKLRARRDEQKVPPAVTYCEVDADE